LWLSPWIEGNAGITELGKKSSSIVESLKDLVSSSSSLETFLLCSAALANLTSLLPCSLTTVSSSSLLLLLLSHPAANSSSIYILEQLVTIVVNMAKLPEARAQLVKAGALNFLYRVLSLFNPGEEEGVVRSAMERTVSKAAIALARLCIEHSTADLVVARGGLDRLFPLAEVGESQCETIRIAAMAAIKTISVYSSVSKSPGSDYYTQEGPSTTLESFV